MKNLIKGFNEYISENFKATDSDRELRDLGVAAIPTKWNVTLVIDGFYAAQNSAETVKEEFLESVVPHIEKFGYRIDVESISLEDWDPDDYEDPDYMDQPGMTFVLESPTSDRSMVEAFVDEEIMGNAFDYVADLEEIID